MLRRRFGRPGLIGTMARTAVIAGTATAVSGGIQRNQQQRAQAEADERQMQADAAAERAQQYQQVAPPPPPAPAVNDTIAQLTKLADLKSAGVLSDAEFAAAKAQLLGL